MFTRVSLSFQRRCKHFNKRRACTTRTWFARTESSSEQQLRLSSGILLGVSIGGAFSCLSNSPSTLTRVASCEVSGVEEKAALLSSLSEEDDKQLLVAVDEAGTRALHWVEASDSWWDECKSVRTARGVNEAVYKVKRIDGFTTRVQMVSAIWDQVSLRELVLLSEATPHCLKIKFDPVIASFEVLHTFSSKQGRLIRTNTKPALLGLISGREVDSVVGEFRPLPDQRWVQASVGLYSPYLEEHVKGRSTLQSLYGSPPSRGKIRAIDHTCGFVFEALDDIAAQGGQGRWRTHYILHSEGGGGVPTWATEKAVGQAIIGWYNSAANELTTMRKSSP